MHFLKEINFQLHLVLRQQWDHFPPLNIVQVRLKWEEFVQGLCVCTCMTRRR